MAENAGVTTRLQSRKIRENLAHQNSGSKRKLTKEVFSQHDDENLNVASAGIYSRRSFPLEHESDQWQKNSKNAAKTESSAKQRRTLCDRGDNNCSKEAALFPLHHHQLHQKPATVHLTSAKEASTTDTWKDRKVYAYHVDVHSGTEYTAGCLLLATETDSCNCLESVKGIPDHIIDIDSSPDSLTTNIYSQDIMEYLMCIEARDLLKPGFLDNSPDVTSRMRGVLMDWLLQVQTVENSDTRKKLDIARTFSLYPRNSHVLSLSMPCSRRFTSNIEVKNHEDLKDETLHLCVTLIDSFLSLVDVKMPKLQLVGITSLLIASKLNERFAPEISTLCYLTDNTFVKEQVLQCERVILQTLGFNLARPVCTTFLDRYLQVHDNPPQVGYLASYLLDLSITNVNLVCALPSLKASCALYLSRLLLLDTMPAWTPDLAYYTNYTIEELHDWTNELTTLLARAPDSKFQGARNKYNTEDYCYVSYCDRLETGRSSLKKCT